MPRRTSTSSFGSTKREGHDASKFYSRNIYQPEPDGRADDLTPAAGAAVTDGAGADAAAASPAAASATGAGIETVGPSSPGGGIDGAQRAAGHPAHPASTARPAPAAQAGWLDRIYCASSEHMPIPDSSVALGFTSPPYNVGKVYDHDMTLDEYLALIKRVAQEVHRVLVPGGRYVINVANLGRKPYIPMHAHYYRVHTEVGFVPVGEIIWRKGRGANGSCAWGSWRSAKSPRLRDVHEYLLVLSKDRPTRPDRGVSDMTGEEFMEATLSVWDIAPESARKVGHPAPFPVALAARVVKLFSYVGDVVLDPFAGSGTTCVAAAQLGRHYVGFDTSEAYCTLARKRLAGPR